MRHMPYTAQHDNPPRNERELWAVSQLARMEAGEGRPREALPAGRRSQRCLRNLPCRQRHQPLHLFWMPRASARRDPGEALARRHFQFRELRAVPPQRAWRTWREPFRRAKDGRLMLIRSRFSNRQILAKQRAVNAALFTRHSLALLGTQT